jgi:uncharacterized protein
VDKDFYDTKMAKNKQTKSLCDKCTGLCCRYIALPIDTPETRKDYDDIRWYLCHENISVFVEDGDWYISVKNVCRHLCPETCKCLIYPKRPEICRRHKAKGCERDTDEYDYELHFTDDIQMEEYIKVKFDNNLTPSGRQNAARKKNK